jgi:hypothetical protein
VYIDQSPGELRLNVVGGPLDLTQFTVLSSGRIAGAQLQVRAGIIGASHVFAVRHGSLPELHEVFACRDLERTEAPARRLFSGGVGELPGQLECAPADGLEYRFRPQVADFESGARDLALLAARVRDAEGKRNQIGLAYTFPAAPDAPDLLPPQTVVWVGVDPDEGGICVETAHCYPNEQTIVFSETRIEIATESAR